MKALFNTLFAAILTCMWAVPQQAYALPSVGSSEKMLRAVFTFEKSKPFVTSLVDDEGKVVSQILTPPAADLSRYLPSRMATEIKAVTKSKSTFKLSAMVAQKLIRFPVESLGFFISLGALVTYDMINKAATNPVGWQQLIDSQLDEVGQVGFLVFMLAQGASAEPFMHMIANGKINPRFGPFITYGGMGIGMVASNIVHEIGHWPGLGQCMKDLWSKSKTQANPNYENCDKAAKHWQDRGGFGGIANEWAPGLISMIGATVLSGVVQGMGKVVLNRLKNGIVEVALISGQRALARAIVVTGIEIAIVIVAPELWAARIGRATVTFLGTIAQLTLFNGIQQWLDRVVASGYNNYFQSGDLDEMESSLAINMMKAKQSQWSEPSSKALSKDVTKFAEMMSKWRQMNMTEVLQAEANWEQKLGQLTMGYVSAKNFYSDFFGRMWERQYGEYRVSYGLGTTVSMLDEIFPLNGVKVAPSAAGVADDTTWLEAPDKIEERQMLTIQNTVRYFQTAQVSQEESRTLNHLFASLSQTNRVIVGKALDQLNCLLRVATSPNCKYEKISNNLALVLSNFRNAIGNPRPIWQPGNAYLISYYNTPANKALIDQTRFQTLWGPLYTPTFAESMMAAMMYGPDVEKNESTVVTRAGFQDLFRPPRIRANDGWQAGGERKGPSGYVSFGDTGIYNYLNTGHVNPNVFGEGQKSFSKWWERNPETHYLQAWLNYERLYQENIARLVKLFSDESSSVMNRGAVSNNILRAYLQEMQLYTMVLGEVMKDSFYLKTGQAPEGAFNKESRVIKASRKDDFIRVVSFLKESTSLDFAAYMKAQNESVTPQLDFANRRNLIWQDRLLTKFEEIRGLFSKLQVQQIPLKLQYQQVSAQTKAEMPLSTLNAQELEAKVQEFTDAVELIKKEVFSDEIILNNSQKALVEICFQAMLKSVGEMKGLANAANAASFVQRHGQQGFVSRRCQIAPPAQGFSGVKAVQMAAEGC